MIASESESLLSTEIGQILDLSAASRKDAIDVLVDNDILTIREKFKGTRVFIVNEHWHRSIAQLVNPIMVIGKAMQPDAEKADQAAAICQKGAYFMD